MLRVLRVFFLLPASILPLVAGFAPESVAKKPTLEDFLWPMIENTDNPDRLREYLMRFPDGDHVDDARRRIGILERTVGNAAAGNGTGGQVTHGQAAGGQAAAGTTPASSDEPGNTYTATLTGTGEAGWANLYLAICGSDVQYAASMTKRNGGWSAELVHSKNSDTVEFKQQEASRKSSTPLMYGYYGLGMGSNNKFALKMVPMPGGRISMTIPNIGTCAVGYLNR